jgi:hypothetical protein
MAPDLAKKTLESVDKRTSLFFQRDIDEEKSFELLMTEVLRFLQL